MSTIFVKEDQSMKKVRTYNKGQAMVPSKYGNRNSKSLCEPKPVYFRKIEGLGIRSILADCLAGKNLAVFKIAKSHPFLLI